MAPDPDHSGRDYRRGGFSIFQAPFKLAAGGVTGIGIIINHFINIPVGMIYLALNVPLIILGFFTLAVGALLFPP
jgi:uncharacterized membrane-anchored protein YitT (DUF2179 family)